MPDETENPGQIHLAPRVVIREALFQWTYARAGGPGGQNVNKLATRATLTISLKDLAPAMPHAALQRLIRLAGQRYAADPPRIIITASDSRSQLTNRRAAVQRLGKLITRAMHQPKRRIPTRPSRRAVQRRLDEKKQHAQNKQSRRHNRPNTHDD